MQLAFGWYNIIELLFCLVARAMWQKKNGVWEIFNAMVLASSQFLGNFPTLSNGVRTITVIVDVIYLILYEIWEHSAD